MWAMPAYRGMRCLPKEGYKTNQTLVLCHKQLYHNM